MRLEDCTTHGCRLEVLFEGTWGSVCSRGFSDETAQQACGMLGFAHGGELNPTKGGGGSIVWLSDVACTGREGDIGDCKHAVRDRRRRGGGGGAPRGAEGVSGGGERVGWVDGVLALGLEAAYADGDPFRRKDGFLDSVFGSPADEARFERSYSQSFHGDYFEGHFRALFAQPSCTRGIGHVYMRQVRLRGVEDAPGLSYADTNALSNRNKKLRISPAAHISSFSSSLRIDGAIGAALGRERMLARRGRRAVLLGQRRAWAQGAAQGAECLPTLPRCGDPSAPAQGRR